MWFERKPTHSEPYLDFLHHLLAEGAHLGGDADGDVVSAAVLAAHAVEHCRALVPIRTKVRLGVEEKNREHSLFTRTSETSIQGD